MRITREPEPASQPSDETSAVRRAPLEDDDAHELQPHEFTLEPEDPVDVGNSFDDVTAPWTTLPPLPPWASTARALLDPPTVPDTRQQVTFIDDQPTPAVEAVVCTATELRAMREELIESARDVGERAQHIDTLKRSLTEANVALAEIEQRRADETARYEGRDLGRAFRIAELEARVHELESALTAAKSMLEERAGGSREHDATVRVYEAQANEREAALREFGLRAAELDATLRERETRAGEREAALREIEARVAERDTALRGHETQVNEREATLRELEARAAERDAALRDREERITERDAALREQESRAAALRENEARVAELDAAMREHETRAALREAALAEHEARATEREAALAEHEARATERDAALREHETRVAERETILREYEARASEREVALREYEARVSEYEATLREYEVRSVEAASLVTPPDRAWVFAAEGDEAFVREAEAFERVAVSAEESSQPEITALVLDDEGNEIVGSDVEVTMELSPSDFREVAEADSDDAAIATPPTESSVEELAPVRPRRGDDLTQIRGIGPRFAKRLHELGVHTYVRIAAWRATDIARIAEQLGVGTKRIQREAWVKQARRLQTRAAAARAARTAPKRPRKRA